MLLRSCEASLRTFVRGNRDRRLATVVVGDCDNFLEVICALLERDEDLDLVARGHDGLEAVEIVARLRPDLLVMDIDMPRIDGLTAALIISTRFPSTKLVLKAW